MGHEVYRALDSQLRGPGFESSCCHFKVWASFTVHSAVNEDLDIDSDGYVNEAYSQYFTQLYASERSRNGFGMSRSARG